MQNNKQAIESYKTIEKLAEQDRMIEELEEASKIGFILALLSLLFFYLAAPNWMEVIEGILK